FYQRLDEKLRAAPGVAEVAFGNQFPLGGRNWQHTFSIDGQQSPQHPASMELNVASTNYFHVLGIPLLRGRYFTEQDNLEHLNGPEFSGKSDEERANASVNVMIIDEEFAGRYWPNEDPIGKRVSGALVVGVVARVKLERLGEQGGLVQAYIPLLQSPDNGGAVVIKTTLEPEAMIAAARRLVIALDPELPIYDVRTLTERLENSLAPERLKLSLLGSFAAAAVLPSFH